MKVFEQNRVNRMENELVNDATIRFELDDVHYTVHINEDNELEIYKIARKTPQTDTIRIKAKSTNIFLVN